jgi:hypothetical protein
MSRFIRQLKMKNALSTMCTFSRRMSNIDKINRQVSFYILKMSCSLSICLLVINLVSEQHGSWSVCADAQAGLDPCWSQTHYVGFVVTRLKYVWNKKNVYLVLHDSIWHWYNELLILCFKTFYYQHPHTIHFCFVFTHDT